MIKSQSFTTYLSNLKPTKILRVKLTIRIKVKFIDFFVSLFIYLIFNNLLLDLRKKIFHSKENVLRVRFF